MSTDKDKNADFTVGRRNSKILPICTSKGHGQKDDCLSLISQNHKNDTSLFCLRSTLLYCTQKYQNYCKAAKKDF